MNQPETRRNAGVEDETKPRGVFKDVAGKVFGYDFFISYCHADGWHYAEQLARRLEERGFDIFLDRDDYAAGDNWKRIGEWTLQRTSRLILIGTAGALQSKPVQREIAIFSQTGRHIIPIDVDGELANEAIESPIFDRIKSETLRLTREDAVENQLPSQAAIDRICQSFDLLRQQEKRTHVFAGIAGALCLLAVVAVGFGILSHLNANEANRQRINAEHESGISLAGQMIAVARRMQDQSELSSLETSAALSAESIMRLQKLKSQRGSADAYAQLIDSLDLMPQPPTKRLPHEREVTDVVLGNVLVTLMADDLVTSEAKVWDIEKSPAELLNSFDSVVDVSRDGERIFTIEGDPPQLIVKSSRGGPNEAIGTIPYDASNKTKFDGYKHLEVSDRGDIVAAAYGYSLDDSTSNKILAWSETGKSILSEPIDVGDRFFGNDRENKLIAFAPDGSCLAAIGQVGEKAALRLYELPSGQLLSETYCGGNLPIYVGFASEKNRMFVVTRDSGKIPMNHLLLRDLDTDQTFRTAFHYHPTNDSLFAAPKLHDNGSHVLIVEGGVLHVWSLDEQRVDTVETRVPIKAAYSSPSGRYVAADQAIWDMRTNERVCLLDGWAKFTSNRVKPEVVTVDQTGSHDVLLQEMTSDVLSTHTEIMSQIGSTVGATLLTVTSNSLDVMDAETGVVLDSLNVDPRGRVVAVDRDRRYVALSNPEQDNSTIQVELWSLKESKLLASHPLANSPSEFVFADEGDYLLIRSRSDSPLLARWDFQSEDNRWTDLTPPTSAAEPTTPHTNRPGVRWGKATIRDDGKYIAATCIDIDAHETYTVIVDAANGQQHRIDERLAFRTGSFDADGNVVTRDASDIMRAYDPSNRNVAYSQPWEEYSSSIRRDLLPESLDHDGKKITAHAYDEQQLLLATVGMDKTVRVWNVSTSQELRRQTLVDIPVEVAFSPNNSRLLLRYKPGPPYELELRVWQIDELLELARSRLGSEALDAVDRQLRGETRVFAKER